MAEPAVFHIREIRDLINSKHITEPENPEAFANMLEAFGLKPPASMAWKTGPMGQPPAVQTARAVLLEKFPNLYKDNGVMGGIPLSLDQVTSAMRKAGALDEGGAVEISLNREDIKASHDTTLDLMARVMMAGGPMNVVNGAMASMGIKSGAKLSGVTP
jgi:hypothetical protein